MSKLLKKLEMLSEGRMQPLGFSAALTRAKSSPMVIVASVPSGDVAAASLAAKEGVDALLLPLEKMGGERKSLSHISSVVADIPWGVSLEAVTRKELEQLIELGCDFVVFAAAKTPAAILGEERVGKILRLDPSLSDSLARAISHLPVDAVFLSIDSDGEPALTVHQVMVYRRLIGAVGKHVLAAIPASLPAADLESLWGLGIRGVVVDLAVEHPEQRLSQLKEEIQRLPATEKKKRRKATAIVPAISASQESALPEEEEEEEEEI